MNTQPSATTPVPDLPEGTVTFLFTDIEGSTKLLERLREQYAVLLDEQRRILRDAFARWNGYEIDTQGDSFFVAFGRAIDAICCVSELQRELVKHDWPAGEIVRVRMGLHTGEPIVIRTGYVGMDVHRAARIAAAGYGGQVLLSQTTRDLVWQDLPKGASLLDLGEYKLKDIRFPQRIYQLGIEGLPTEFASLKTLSAEEEPPSPGEPPYKGLQYFTESDAGRFFGRERATQTLLQAVQEQRFMTVIGASGSGKSSVVRAGLVPAITRPGPQRWQVALFTPGAHPLESLAVSLTSQARTVVETAALVDDLQRDARCLHLFTLRVLPQSNAGSAGQKSRLLIVVDQFEELFTMCRTASERQVFLDNLLYAATAQGGATHVLVVLRADFYQYLSEYPGLREQVAKHQEYLGTMSAEELKLAIEAPAQQGGWEFSPGLVDLILHDVGASPGGQPEPGALPLLSHALLETWKHRRGNQMTLRAYWESGGVRGAIARTAETVYRQELNPEQQETARDIFLRLTELGEGTQDTRRRVALTELLLSQPDTGVPPVQIVLNILADARLIALAEDTVEVAHEALIREWPTLRDWLTTDREGLRLHRHITEAAQEWELLERDPGALLRGARLAQAQEWADVHPRQLNLLENSYILASQEAAQHEQAEREAQRQRELQAARKLAEAEKQRAEDQTATAKRLRKRAWALGGAFVLALILAAAAIIFGRQASTNYQLANQRQATAESESLRAESEARQRATAESVAIVERSAAQQQAALATSRELAAAAFNNLEVDPERSILLALEALNKADTLEAQGALHQAILASRLVASIPADSQSVFGVAVSPDGNQFASAGMDGVVKIWAMNDFSALSGASPLLVLENPIDFEVSWETGGYTLAFSPDGSRLAVLADNQSAKIFDASSGQLLQTLSNQNGNVYGLAFDPDGKRLVTTSAGGMAVVWDVLNGDKLNTVTVPEYAIYGAIFTPDGKGLITGSDDAVARFWDLDDNPGTELFSLSFDYSLEGPPGAFAFSPDGKFLAMGTGQVARVWDFQALQADPAVKPLFTLYGHQNNNNSLAYTSDGTRLVTGNADGTARVWEAATGQALFTLSGGTGTINSLAISPDGIHPVSAHSDGQVRIWDISPTGSHEWWAIYPAHRGRISPDGRRLATGYKTSEMTGETLFQLWELAPSGVKLLNSVSVNPGARVSVYGFSPDLSRYVTIDSNMLLKLWDPASGQLMQSFPINQTETSSGHTDIVFGFDCSPDGNQCVTGGDDGKAIVWDVASGKPLLTLTGHEGPVRGVNFNPDGARMATAGFDGTSRIWDVATGQQLQTFSGHAGIVIEAVFSPDGKRLLTGSSDTTAKVWDVQTGQELLTLKGHISSVFWVGFSPDGTRLVTGSTDGSVKVWDASTGQALLTLPGFYVEFAPDGKSLMAISLEDMVGRGFYLDVQELISLAHARVTRSLTQAECQQYLHLEVCPTSLE